MKKQVLFVATLLFATQLTTAQVLYSEKFDNLTLGNVGTDCKGATPGQGGWYTTSNTATANQSNNYFKVVSEPNKGKVLELSAIPNSATYGGNFLQKKDLHLLWNHRSNRNDICKLEFDFYTENPVTSNGTTHFWLMANNDNSISNTKKYIVGFIRYFGTALDGLFFKYNLGNDVIDNTTPKVVIPANSWVKIIIYLDYINNTSYINIPSLNLWKVKSNFLINSTAVNPMDDFTPTAIIMQTERQNQNISPYKIKYDNFILEALKTMPSASKDDYLNTKFKIYPNPAKDVLIVHLNEKIKIKKIAIYNINGKIIDVQNGIDEKENFVNVENLSAGTYLLHITTDSGTTVKSFSKK